MEKITDYLYVIRAVEQSKLSADTFLIKGRERNYLYDAGDDESRIDELNSYDVRYLFLSHFHKDHIGAASLIKCEKIYGSRMTAKKVKGCQTVSSLHIEDGVTLDYLEIPSSHCKGSCILTVNHEITLVGDSTYMDVKGRYNATLLLDMINVLKNVGTKYFIVSHKSERLIKKEVMIKFLQFVYNKREKNSPYIEAEEGLL